MEAPPREMEALPGVVDVHSGAIELIPVVVQVHPGAEEAQA